MKLVVVDDCAELHELPLSVLYCHVASVSTPLTVTLAFLVTSSKPFLPVSAVKAKVGVLGKVVSMVQLMVLLVTVDTLPAKSVCRTCTAPLA